MRKLTKAQERMVYMMNLARQLGCDWQQCCKLAQLESAAESLRKRFEAECSYDWANTPEYQAKTERAIEKVTVLIKEISASPPTAEINRDPRGSSVRLFIGAREYFL